MTQLPHQIPDSFADAPNIKAIFRDEKQILDILAAREQPKLNVPGESCKTELFLGFFFDGTRNNYAESDTPRSDGTAKLNHTNVARLYDCFPGMSVPGVLPRIADWDFNLDRYSHFFRVYVPGVGTPFKQIGDSGGASGAGFGTGGEGRIIWALVQAMNCIHRYFLKMPIFGNDEAYRLAHSVSLGQKQLRETKPGPKWAETFARNTDTTCTEFTDLLKRLHAALAPNLIDKLLGRPQKIDPGIVKKINISIFGFSRGSAQARAFASWFAALCLLDGRLRFEPEGTLTLAGFPVEFSFMGLFDTVASVGFANTMGTILGQAEGHDDWADADLSLRVPSQILNCLHLVAAHEVRRSFPLDSVSVGKSLPSNCKEIVFPGVHSDLGGAYCPTEQGKGVDATGADMLSRIPLIYMYREARLAGVPLKLELAKPVTKDRFRLAPSTIKAFNAYIAQCPTKSGDMTALMREQRQLYIRWKVLRRASGSQALQDTASFARARPFDQNDLHSANLEFEAELATFEAWHKSRTTMHGTGTRRQIAQKAQPPGFDNSHTSEWEEIATWWDRKADLHVDVVTFFDDYVHDSRAWFKLIPSKVVLVATGASPDNEDEMRGLLEEWAHTRRTYWSDRSGKVTRVTDHLTPDQRAAAEAYVRTGNIPRMVNSGRETFTWAKAGYLRYRKVYAGANAVLLSQMEFAEQLERAG